MIFNIKDFQGPALAKLTRTQTWSLDEIPDPFQISGLENYSDDSYNFLTLWMYERQGFSRTQRTFKNLNFDFQFKFKDFQGECEL